MSRVAFFAVLVLLGCGDASEPPDAWTDQPQLCPLDEHCGERGDENDEIEVVPPPDGGGP